MITKISICNQDELIPWKLNKQFFKERYPSIYENSAGSLENMDYWGIEEIVPDGEPVEDMTIQMESVKLCFSDGMTHTIYNTDIINWNGIACEGYSIYSDSQFVYFIISRAAFQAGSLGIWSIADKDWVFTRSNECFCVEAVIFSPYWNTFIGFAEWNYPMSPQGGEYFFIIRSDRSYSEIELEEVRNFNWENAFPEAGQRFLDWDDHFLGFAENYAIIYLIRGDKRTAYKLNAQQMKD
jgi:hypothetical protein